MLTTIPLDKFPGANPFLMDYAAHYPRVEAWFHYDPHHPQSLARRLAELDDNNKSEFQAQDERGALASAIQAQQRRWGAGERAQRAAQALAEPTAYTVATGQQVGLYGGPLYTVFKALSAVKCARRLAAEFPDRVFVPTFWLGTSDSDFEEIRQHWLLDGAGAIHEIALPAESDAEAGLLIAARKLTASLEATAQELTNALPSGPWRDQVLNDLLQAYRNGSLVDGFACWLAQLLSDTELVLVDPQDPILMRAAAPLIRYELEHASENWQLLDERDAALRAAGYAPQLTRLEDDTGLFLVDSAGHREKVARGSSGFRLRQSGVKLSVRELLEAVETAPENFVLGVTLRPLYQNTLFPVAAFIGGPAEIAYRSQLTALFDQIGQRQAPAFLRASATLLTDRAAAVLAELGWSLDECFTLPQDLAAKAVQAERPAGLDGALARYRQAVAAADGELEGLAVDVEPSLEKAFSTLRANFERHIEKLEKKITSALKRRNEALLGKVERLHSLVYPRQVAQERKLSLLSFLPRYGYELVPYLLEQLKFPNWEHQTITLE